MRTGLGKPKPTMIWILFDLGSSSTIVFKPLVKKLRIKQATPTEWQTAMGNFETTEKSKIQFFLPEFHVHNLTKVFELWLLFLADF